MSGEPLTVVAALITSPEGLLICQRRRKDSFGLKWEFPGGKIHAGEAPREALRRELREELGIECEIGAEVYRTRHRYAQFPRELELIFYPARPLSGEVRNFAFEQIRWARVASLTEYDFLPADHELIEQLAQGRLALPPHAIGRP